MKMYIALHPQADADRLYIPKNKGGRGMISVEDYVEMEIPNLKRYVSMQKAAMKDY